MHRGQNSREARVAVTKAVSRPEEPCHDAAPARREATLGPASLPPTHADRSTCQPSTARTTPLTVTRSTAVGPAGSLGRSVTACDEPVKTGPKRLDGAV